MLLYELDTVCRRKNWCHSLGFRSGIRQFQREIVVNLFVSTKLFRCCVAKLRYVEPVGLTMTVKDCKSGDATCGEDTDPFLSQDSENLLGRVLAGMTIFHRLSYDCLILKCLLFIAPHKLLLMPVCLQLPRCYVLASWKETDAVGTDRQYAYWSPLPPCRHFSLLSNCFCGVGLGP